MADLILEEIENLKEDGPSLEEVTAVAQSDRLSTKTAQRTNA